MEHTVRMRTVQSFRSFWHEKQENDDHRSGRGGNGSYVREVRWRGLFERG